MWGQETPWSGPPCWRGRRRQRKKEKTGKGLKEKEPDKKHVALTACPQKTMTKMQ